MAIKVEIESEELSREFGGLLESCVFCGVPTKYWHMRTNNPVCPICAPDHKVKELTDYGKRIRTMGKVRKKN